MVDLGSHYVGSYVKINDKTFRILSIESDYVRLIYDGVLDDMYDYFYDGIISDGYDYAPYKEWSDILSEEYDMWSDTLSDVYDSWSDALSDIYGFWSDVSGAMWDNDMEEIKTEIEKFKEDIKELKE